VIKPRVLFLCTHNSCRSQMAEGLLRHLAGQNFEVFSAGADATELNPDAIEVMREIGIDISGQHSKDASQFLPQRFTYVVTVCDRAKERCPIFPGAIWTLHWPFDDPASAQGPREERLKVFRRVRDEIEARIREFVAKES
jgi:arsenate reductase